MAKKSLVLILVLASMGLSSAWMIEGEVSPHQGDRETLITISYWVNVTSDARVKVYLNAYDPVANGFDYNIDKTLIEYFEVQPANLSPIKLKLTNTASGLYRVCLRLAHNGSYYRDCDKANQFLLIDDTPILLQGVQEESPDLRMIVNSTSQVIINKLFLTNLTVINKGSGAFEGRVYSYVRNNSGRVSTGSYSGNQEGLFLSPGAETWLSLGNKVAWVGNHTLVVKAVGRETYECNRDLEAVNPSGKSFLSDLRVINGQLRVVASNTGAVNKSLLVRFYSLNNSFAQEVNLLPRRSVEFFVNSSAISGMVYVFLYEEGLLIDEKSFLMPLENGTPASLGNETPFDNGTSVAVGVVEDRETLLYPVIVLFSLVMMGLLLWKN